MSKVYDFILINMVYFYTFFDNVGYFSSVKQNWKKQIWNHDGLDDVSFREFTRKKTKHDVNFQKLSYQ